MHAPFSGRAVERGKLWLNMMKGVKHPVRLHYDDI